jgi:hypothetical protein
MRAYIGEVTLMAAIVTSLLCVPVGALLAGLLYVAGISLYAFATFGGALDGFLALLAWWLLGFLPALGYSAYLVPWSRRES